MSPETIHGSLQYGHRYLVSYTGTAVCRPDVGGFGAMEVDGHNALVRRLDGFESVTPIIGVTGEPWDGKITSRQLDILLAGADGAGAAAIGKRLGISEGTVHTHLQALMRKLKVNNRTHLIVRAIQLGLLVAAPDRVRVNVMAVGRVDEVPSRLAELTNDEKVILPLLAENLTHQEIGERAFFSRSKVSGLIRRICAKWGLANRAQIVAVAAQHGVLEVRRAS